MREALGSFQNLGRLRKNAPQIIVVAIVIIVVLYFVISFLDDVVIEGNPMSSTPIIGFILAISNGVTSFVQAFGDVGVFILMFLESSSLPIPSEVILPFAGYLIFEGSLNFWIVLAAATVAGLLGSVIDYYIGLKGVQSLIKHKIWGKILLSTAQLDVAEKWFSKYGSLMIFVSRLIPGFRTTFSFPAGAVKMPMKKFIAYTTAGCLLWNVTLIYLGWFLGKNWREVAGITRYLLVAAVGAVVIVVVAYLLVQRRKMRQEALRSGKEQVVV